MLAKPQRLVPNSVMMNKTWHGLIPEYVQSRLSLDFEYHPMILLHHLTPTIEVLCCWTVIFMNSDQKFLIKQI